MVSQRRHKDIATNPRAIVRNWYCAKSIESYCSNNEFSQAPFIVLENIVLLTAPNLQLAKLRAAHIGEEQAGVVGKVSLFNGRQCTVKFEGLRSLALLQHSDAPLAEGTISHSIFKPALETDMSKFLQEGAITGAVYLGGSAKFINREKVDDCNVSARSKTLVDKPWVCAHLIFSMVPTSADLPPLVFEEIRMFAQVDDSWGFAETLGENLERRGQKVEYRSETYNLQFIGVREVQSISGRSVYTIPVNPTQASHTKFEISSEADLIRLLNGAETSINLLPATLCHIQMVDLVAPYLPPTT